MREIRDTAVEPLVSIIVCVRNGMPYLQSAIESILALEYENYEVVLQDGASTDGSLEYLREFEHRPRWSLISEADNGIGQGFNRAVQRCIGDIVASVDADNRLRPHALTQGAAAFHAAPNSAAVYGNCAVIDATGALVQEWVPPHFDLLDLIDGTVVPPFASAMFSRRICGKELRFDETMSIVPDFDLWLRLSQWPIEKMTDDQAGVEVRIGEMSSTWTKDTYDRQCALKCHALRRFLEGPGSSHVVDALRKRSEGGLYLWGVDSMGVIGAGESDVNRYFDRALDADIKSDRFRDVVSRTQPRIGQADSALWRRILDEGLARLRRLKFEDALVYFELLKRSGTEAGDLDALIETTSARTATAAIELRDRLMAERIEAAQHEINRRDTLLADLERHFQTEVSNRDRALGDLRAEITALNGRIAHLESLRGSVAAVKHAVSAKLPSLKKVN